MHPEGNQGSERQMQVPNVLVEGLWLNFGSWSQRTRRGGLSVSREIDLDPGQSHRQKQRRGVAASLRPIRKRRPNGPSLRKEHLAS